MSLTLVVCKKIFPFVLLALCFLLYWPATHATFYWDDQNYIFHNSAMDMSSPLAFWLRGTDYTKAWPLTYTVFWCVRKIFGDQAEPFHVLLLTLHTANAWLLCSLLRKGTAVFAWPVALIFLFHPLHIETLSWIMQTNMVMSCFFLLLTMHSLRRFFEQKKHWYWSALLFFSAALASKSSVIFFSILFFLFFYVHMGIKQAFIRTLPFIGITAYFTFLAVVGAYTFNHERNYALNYTTVPQVKLPVEPIKIFETKTAKTKQNKSKKSEFGKIKIVFIPPEERKSAAFSSSGSEKTKNFIYDTVSNNFSQKLALAGQNFLFYSLKFIFPSEQKAVYPKQETNRPLGIILFVSAALMTLYLAFLYSKTQKLWHLGFLIAYLGFLPISGLFYVGYMKYAWVADRWSYFLVLGFCLALADLFEKLSVRWGRNVQIAIHGGLFVILLQFIWQSHNYAHVFNSRPQQILLPDQAP